MTLAAGTLPGTPDVLVVGGGTAGCVVAGRLAEDPGRSVLLLEAGGRDDDPAVADRVRTPLRALGLLRGPLDWSDSAVPQAALDGRILPTSAGRVLGGGGSINFLAWVRGHPLDYDGWAAAGMAGWSWADVLPAFRRVEDHPLGPSPWHGAGGPVAVTTAPDVDPLSRAFVAAGRACGLPFNPDVNGAEQDGVGPLWSSVRDGERSSTARALRGAHRPNLTVRTGAVARRVLVERGRATGVEWRDAAGRVHRTRAGRVVLCAGAFRSPQLLLLSGIGAAAALRAHGLEVVTDLPGVGANLHDHPAVVGVWPAPGGTSWAAADGAVARRDYAVRRGGPLASIGQAVAFLRTAPGLPAPDVQLTPMLTDLSGRAGSDGPFFSCMATLLTPTSRGRVTLRSADPHTPPLIDPRWLATGDDRAVLLAGLHRMLDVVAQPSLAALLGSRRLPAPEERDLPAFVRAVARSHNHPVGTCRAGIDADAVVGPDLAVHGVADLFVADASVMPTVPRGNTNAASAMIGERAAALLAG